MVLEGSVEQIEGLLVVGVVQCFVGLSGSSVMSGLCGDYLCLILSLPQILVWAPLR